MIRLFKSVALNGDIAGWARNDLNMSSLMRVRGAGYAWTLAPYHRGIKQFGGVERAQVRAARAQRHPIGLGVRAFRRLECYC